MPKDKWTRLPARDGKTPSNYATNSKGETWYHPPKEKTIYAQNPAEETRIIGEQMAETYLLLVKRGELKGKAVWVEEGRGTDSQVIADVAAGYPPDIQTTIIPLSKLLKNTKEIQNDNQTNP